MGLERLHRKAAGQFRHIMPRYNSIQIIAFICTVLLFSACNQQETYTFKEVACFSTEIPAFDGHIVQILDNATGAEKDTLIEKIAKTRKVFKSCRQYIYNAIYKDSNGSVLSTSKVWMMATGKRWEWQPENQDELAVQFEVLEERIPELKKQFINKKFAAGIGHFNSQETTGIIENVQEVWMHPFRANQFHFTEVAAFPAVKFPLEIGKSWTSNLRIGEGWGDWENTTVNSSYKVVDRTKLTTGFKEFIDCWKVEAKSTASFGDSQHNFWFDEEYGFVKMEYLNYQGQTLLFELVEVVEK